MTDRRQIQTSDLGRTQPPFNMRVQAKRSTRIEGTQIVKEVQFVFDFGDGVSAASTEVRRFGFSEGNRSLMMRPEVLRNKPSTETYVWNTPSLTSADHASGGYEDATKELPSAARSSSRSSRASWLKTTNPEFKKKEACTALSSSSRHYKKSQMKRRPPGFNCGKLFDDSDNVVTDQRKLSKSPFAEDKHDLTDLRKEARALIARMKSRVSPGKKPGWQRADDLEIISLDSDPKDESKIGHAAGPKVTFCDDVMEAATDVDEEDNGLHYESSADEPDVEIKSMKCDSKDPSPPKTDLRTKLSHLVDADEEGESNQQVEPISDEDYPFEDEEDVDYEERDDYYLPTDRTSNLDVDDLGLDGDDESRLTMKHTSMNRKPFIFKKGFITSVFRTSSWSDNESSDNNQPSHGYYSSPVTRAQYLARNTGPSLVESFSKFFRKSMPWRYGRSGSNGDRVQSTPDLQQGKLADGEKKSEGEPRPQPRRIRRLPKDWRTLAQSESDDEDVVVAYHHREGKARSSAASNSSSPDPSSKTSKKSDEHGLRESDGVMNLKLRKESGDLSCAADQARDENCEDDMEDYEGQHGSSSEDYEDEDEDPRDGEVDYDRSEVTFNYADHDEDEDNDDGNFGDDEYDPGEERSERSSSIIPSETETMNA